MCVPFWSLSKPWSWHSSLDLLIIDSAIPFPIVQPDASAESFWNYSPILSMFCKATLTQLEANNEAVRATLPPSTLFADRALLHRGYSISDPNALVEAVSKYKGLH